MLRTGDAFAVSVDGRDHLVDVVRIDAHTLSLIVDSGVQGGRLAVYEAVVVPSREAGQQIVQVGGVAVPLTADRRRVAQGDDSRPGSGPFRLTAPMPGKVVKVLVTPGQAVQVRQPIVIVEAMKMENALRSDRGGTVAEVLVHPGTSVEAGALLVVIQ
jgi:biotin carboxyl carrier protein